jgi:hypothetical protein
MLKSCWMACDEPFQDEQQDTRLFFGRHGLLRLVPAIALAMELSLSPCHVLH